MNESDGTQREYRLTVPPACDGYRMDRAATLLLDGVITRSRLLETLIRARRNGDPVKPSSKVRAGDVLDLVCSVPPPFESVRPEPIPLDVVYEDDHILIVNKPWGMPVHPSHGHPGGTIVNALLHRYGTLPGSDVRPGIIHRLDKDTSGLLVCAKSGRALESMSALFKAREVKKEYTAVVRGIPYPASGVIDRPIGRDPRHRKKQAVVPGGKPALTEYRILRRFESAALVGIRLHTGRTHQIRVHLRHIGCPILGDPLYSRRIQGYERLCLASTGLYFIHPLTGLTVDLSIPLPPHMEAALSRLEGQSP